MAPNSSQDEKNTSGFTIVELLIGVVIGILAAITLVAFNGIQGRARYSQRRSDISHLRKTFELYYIDNGRFPPSNGGSTTINARWSTTADASWQNLSMLLTPYMDRGAPSDPDSMPGVSVLGGTGYNYAYFANGSTNPVGPYASTNASNVRVRK